VKLKFMAALLGLMMAIPGAVVAQNDTQNPNDQAPDQYDRPITRRLRKEKSGVARISLIHGDVSTQRGDSGIGRRRR
jgi:hypothetical protein